MRTIYVVRGTTGEYSDFTFWDVRAFFDESAAIALMTLLNNWCIENKLDDRGNYRSIYGKPPEDPGFKNYYTGTTYGVIPIPMDENFVIEMEALAAAVHDQSVVVEEISKEFKLKHI